MGNKRSVKESADKGRQLGKVDTLLNEKNVKWGEFKIEDLFEKIKVKSLKYKASELPSQATNDFILPALTAGIQNQGLNNFVPEHNATILKNVISISANGANTGATFYQSKKFTVLQDAYAIQWKSKKEILTDNKYLFLTASISKTIYGNYEWTNKAGWERIKSQKISLPIKNGREIDFDFIESFVTELEASRIKELDNYLKDNGLSDCHLTEKEKQALEDFEGLEWGKFKIEDLFEKIKVKSLKYKTSELPSEATNNFILPALTAGIQNQGLNNFVPEHNVTILKNVISISANGANTGATFYQSKKFTVLQDAYAIQWKSKKEILTDNKYLFLTASISKTIYGNYEWTNKAGWERIKSQKISLPIKNNKPDYETMETIISAIRKLVIKDVVLYVQKKEGIQSRVCGGTKKGLQPLANIAQIHRHDDIPIHVHWKKPEIF